MQPRPLPPYTVNMQERTCFPTGMDTSSLVDVTRLTDTWRRFIDPDTGKEFDCAKYWADAHQFLR